LRIETINWICRLLIWLCKLREDAVGVVKLNLSLLIIIKWNCIVLDQAEEKLFEFDSSREK
jgi:hypothetical protein